MHAGIFCSQQLYEHIQRGFGNGIPAPSSIAIHRRSRRNGHHLPQSHLPASQFIKNHFVGPNINHHGLLHILEGGFADISKMPQNAGIQHHQIKRLTVRQDVQKALREPRYLTQVDRLMMKMLVRLKILRAPSTQSIDDPTLRKIVVTQGMSNP